MTKYLQNLILRFEGIKHGMKINQDKWKAMSETTDNIDEQIMEIKDVDGSIGEIKKQLSRMQQQAREIRDKKKTVIQRMEKRAIGLHADDEERLEDYNIKIKSR